MSAYTLTIHWLHSVETILIEPSHEISEGSEIHTYERWPGYASPIPYLVKVTRVTRSDTDYTLELLYEAARNPRVPQDCPWGISTITLNLVTGRANAHWKSELPSTVFDGDARVDVTKNELNEDLGVVMTEVRRRAQGRFRTALAAVSSCCEISGEVAPWALEAAHIIEVKDTGGYSANNGILLRADLHRLFDRGLLSIDMEGNVSVSKNLPAESGYHALASNWRLSESTLLRVKTALAIRIAAST